MNKCNHNYDQFIHVTSDGVFSTCTNCNKIFKLTTNYETNKFHTSVKPTNHDKKIFNITKLDDGSFFYERKIIDD